MSLQLAARITGTSARTLQRRLYENGTSFSAEIRSLRRETAARLLSRSEIPVVDVAVEMGYSDHSHFTRAFKAWTGLTPSAFRRNRLSD